MEQGHFSQPVGVGLGSFPGGAVDGLQCGVGVSQPGQEEQKRGRQGARFPSKTLPFGFLGYERTEFLFVLTSDKRECLVSLQVHWNIYG